jgi:hypothetical protein
MLAQWYLEELIFFKDLGTDGRIILKCILKECRIGKWFVFT